MTFQEIQQDVLARVDDIENEELANMVKTWINQTYLDICNRANWRFLESIYTTTITSEQNTIDLSSSIPNLNKIYDVTITDENGVITRLDYIPEDIFNRIYDSTAQNTRGVPKFYRIWADTMSFYPLLDADYTVTIKHTFYPNVMINPGEAPIIPEPYHELIVLGATAKARQFNDDFEEADLLQKEYEAKLNLMMAKLKKQITTPPRFRGYFNRQLGR